MSRKIASDSLRLFCVLIASSRGRSMRLLSRYSLVALVLALATPACADEDVAAFYRGKTLQLTNAFAEGGLYSTLARVIVNHLPRHVPGRPNAIPIFMPGAGGLRQMNHLYN